MEHGLQPRPACVVVCLGCANKSRWEQPFPTLEAAERWKRAHTERYGHEQFDTVEATP